MTNEEFRAEAHVHPRRFRSGAWHAEALRRDKVAREARNEKRRWPPGRHLERPVALAERRTT
mgnify:CR=1 FL=1